MAEPKRLYRSRDRKIAGVCGGIGAYLDVDPTVVRVVWLLLTIFTVFFPGIIAYLVLWFVVPEEPPAQPQEVAPHA